MGLQEPKSNYLTPAEVAEAFLVSPVTVRQWAQKGWLEAEVTPGGHRRFHRNAVEAFARDRGVTVRTSAGERFRLLIVDDDRAVVAFLAELLGGDGDVEVETAYDGFDAGQKVRAFSPHAMLLDLKMPGLDGFEVCRRLKGAPETSGIEVIAMSGYYSAENARRILDAGACLLLEKPIDTDALIASLSRIRARYEFAN